MTASTESLRRHQNRRGTPRTGRKDAEADSPPASHAGNASGRARGPKKFAFFGHFDGTNFGNECSLQTALYHLYRLQPEAHVTCICSGPQTTASTYHVRALSFSGEFGKPWTSKGPLTRMVRKINTVLSAPFRLLKCIRAFHGIEMLVIPGTGLLTDAYGLRGWGPFGLLKWSLIAKACGCEVVFVSIGAGPIYSSIGRWCVKLILLLADFRSYRDASTVHYLKEAGLVGDDKAVFPDLAFSLPECMIPRRNRAVAGRPVVGLGVMEFPGKYSHHSPTQAAFREYLDTLAESTEWLLNRGYDIQLLSGDIVDTRARLAFRRALEERLQTHGGGRIIDEPASSFMDVLSQIASTEFVVATRFHNVVFGYLCEKPVISIAFHHKCKSLMAMMGMSDYCLEMAGLKADQLIDTLRRLEANAYTLRPVINGRITAFRQALDQQYDTLFGRMRPEHRAIPIDRQLRQGLRV